MSAAPIELNLGVDELPAIRELTTIAECDVARAALTDEVAAIQSELTKIRALVARRGKYANPERYELLVVSLRRKRIALQEEQQVRAKINRADREMAQQTRDKILLVIIKQKAPTLFAECVDEARALHPNKGF